MFGDLISLKKKKLQIIRSEETKMNLQKVLKGVRRVFFFLLFIYLLGIYFTYIHTIMYTYIQRLHSKPSIIHFKMKRS